MPGPYLIHSTRNKEDYEYFGRHLTHSLKGKIITMCGTDGEKALMVGLKMTNSFKETDWLICMLHAKDNCKRKMKEIGLSDKSITSILSDIYGSEFNTLKGKRHRINGIIDSQSADDFKTKLQVKITKWNDVETHDTGKNAMFSNWFMKNKADECIRHMLIPIRVKAGLGSPPRQFTTNDVECENLNLKRFFEWKKATWDVAANQLHTYVLRHYEEMGRAVYKEGKYRVDPKYNELELEPFDWAKMSVGQRKLHLQQAKLKPTEPTILTISAEDSGLSTRGFSVGELCETWGKASQIVKEQDSIVRCPGNNDKLVVFEDEHVHNVNRKLDQFYVCDSRCDSFRYYEKLLCQHTIAVAERDANLIDLLSAIYVRIEARPSLNKLISEKCGGAGEKKNKKRKGNNNILANEITSTSNIREYSSTELGTRGILTEGLGSVRANDQNHLPPLTSMQMSLQNKQPVTVTFRQGLIRKCSGCKNAFSDKKKKKHMM